MLEINDDHASRKFTIEVAAQAIKKMPKISDIQETPNPNAVKFILREPVTSGVALQFDSAEKGQSDALAKSLFDIGNVVSVFYHGQLITVKRKTRRLGRVVTDTGRPNSRGGISGRGSPNGANGIGGALAAVMSDDPRLMRINEILDEKGGPPDGRRRLRGNHRPDDHTLNIRYQGACGSCPSFALRHADGHRRMLKQEVDPEIEVVAPQQGFFTSHFWNCARCGAFLKQLRCSLISLTRGGEMIRFARPFLIGSACLHFSFGGSLNRRHSIQDTKKPVLPGYADGNKTARDLEPKGSSKSVVARRNHS